MRNSRRAHRMWMPRITNCWHATWGKLMNWELNLKKSIKSIRLLLRWSWRNACWFTWCRRHQRRYWVGAGRSSQDRRLSAYWILKWYSQMTHLGRQCCRTWETEAATSWESKAVQISNLKSTGCKRTSLAKTLAPQKPKRNATLCARFTRRNWTRWKRRELRKLKYLMSLKSGWCCRGITVCVLARNTGSIFRNKPVKCIFER